MDQLHCNCAHPLPNERSSISCVRIESVVLFKGHVQIQSAYKFLNQHCTTFPEVSTQQNMSPSLLPFSMGSQGRDRRLDTYHKTIMQHSCLFVDFRALSVYVCLPSVEYNYCPLAVLSIWISASTGLISK